jgi:hypothetical protein
MRSLSVAEAHRRLATSFTKAGVSLLEQEAVGGRQREVGNDQIIQLLPLGPEP